MEQNTSLVFTPLRTQTGWFVWAMSRCHHLSSSWHPGRQISTSLLGVEVSWLAPGPHAGARAPWSRDARACLLALAGKPSPFPQGHVPTPPGGKRWVPKGLWSANGWPPLSGPLVWRVKRVWALPSQAGFCLTRSGMFPSWALCYRVDRAPATHGAASQDCPVHLIHSVL